MNDVERLAAENARLKAALSQSGFKITYNKQTGFIVKITPPRKPVVRHTAITWARKKGFKGSMTLVKELTKNKAITERKFKNTVERAEAINDAKEFIKLNKYQLPDKYFNRIPTYVLKNTDFYENVNAILNSLAKNDDQKELTNADIKYSIDFSVGRIKKLNKPSKPKLKLR